MIEARDLLLSPDLTSEDAARFLHRFGFNDGVRADQVLGQMADISSLREPLARIISDLLSLLSSTSDPDATLIQLLTFFELAPSPANLASYLGENQGALEVLIRIVSSSPHLTQILLRNPEYLYWLTTSDQLRLARTEEDLRREAEQYLELGKQAGLESLRRFRRRETLRIASQDLLETVSFRSTVQQLSSLARVILQTVLTLLVPGGNQKGFAVFAFGKLGGGELNYSSDIDLLYVFSDDSDSSRMLRLAREYTKALNEFTPEGTLFRVDLRLRPLGKGGQIAYPLGAFRQYYETTADTFDRLALLKCTWAAGDQKLGEEFLDLAHHFTYRKYLDLAAIDELRWLKNKTDRRMRDRGETSSNVKLGFGGIREIEFFVQSFQLLYGGRHPEIRSPNTLDALSLLVDGGFISSQDFEVLRNAYFFLRTVEHRLQLVHDLQTHSLPDDPGELARCAVSMTKPIAGETSPDFGVESFVQELEATRDAVHRIFSSLFSDAGSSGVSEVILNPKICSADAVQLLEKENVPDPWEVWEALSSIQKAPSFPYTPTRVRNLLANLLPDLLQQCRLSPHPRAFLNRFDRFCDSMGSRAELYLSLIEEPEFARSFFRVLSAGEFLSETLIQHPELLDSLSVTASPDTFPNRLRSRIGQLGDPVGFPRILSTFKRREEFKIALDYLENLKDSSTRESLSDLAEACIQATCNHLVSESRVLGESSFALFSLGKLGGRELTFHSDLDLILVYDDSIATVGPTEFNRFIRGLTETLQKYTESGRIYAVDFRLRPEGRRAAPANPLSAFQNYFLSRAEPWERLAYVKLRRVFAVNFLQEASSLLPVRPLTASEVSQLLHVRRRKELELGKEDADRCHFDFKVGAGALMDIQFIVQYSQLQHDVREESTLQALSVLRRRRLLDESQANGLAAGLKFLFNLESISRLLEERPTSKLQVDSDMNTLRASLMGFEDSEDLFSAYRKTRSSIRDVFRTVFGVERE